jgi:hypothetical protein
VVGRSGFNNVGVDLVGEKMTNEESKIIADVLRHRIIEIRKMFEPADAHVPQDQVEQAMIVQILVLAQDLDVAFSDSVFVEAVRSETNRTK